ncbi:uncharacterized protein [Asterias amurensis]|uniref:uncharacterized protein isoform X2 n=1 Tax=Asterias amurensis TaxID=7602 RepID=UPI003AB5F2B4
MEDNQEDLTSLHYQIMFPPREPCHRQREYELEQHLALMDEPATASPATSMDMGDLGNLTIEHLSGYDDVSDAHKFLLVDDDRYRKEDVLELGIEAADLGSLLQQFEQKEAALTTTDPIKVSEPQQTSSVEKKLSGPKNPTKKIAPVKRKSTILMEPIAMPSKRLREKIPEERMTVSLPGSRTTSPLTVEPQGLSVICSADQGFDYLIMDHDYCNVQDPKLANQDPPVPVNKASQLAAEQRKALYKQKYKIRKKGKTKGRVVGGHYSENSLAEGLVGGINKPAFINKLPDYIHPMPEVSPANTVKHAEGKQKQQGVVPMPQPLLEKEAPHKGKKPEFFDKIPDYFIGKHMYQEISKVKEAEEEAKKQQALEEEMTKLKEKPAETESLHKKSSVEPSKDNEGTATHPDSNPHHHKSRHHHHHHHHHHHKVHTHSQLKNTDIKDRDDALISNGGEMIDGIKIKCEPLDNETEQTSNSQTSGDKQTQELHVRKSRKSSYSERLPRSRSRSRSYSSYSRSSSRSSVRSRSYSSSSLDSRYSRSRHRGRSYISRSRSRSYSRSRSRSRSRSYIRRRRRYSTYSSASHSSSSISRSRSRSHSRSRHWRPRSHSRSFSRSPSRSRSRSHSGESRMRQRQRSSHRESRPRTHRSDRRDRRDRRSASIEQIEERREQRIEEQLEQWKDRRVVYIGRIPYGTTRTVIRKRFEKFGEIERITLHFRDEGDNYAFVTYNFKCDAYAAVEGANKDPDEPVYDICFGGRRQFCKSNYEDLDSMAQEEDAFDYGYKPSSSSNSGKAQTDFDKLLQEAMRKSKR